MKPYGRRVYDQEILVRIDTELKEELVKYCAKEGRSGADVIREAIKEKVGKKRAVKRK